MADIHWCGLDWRRAGDGAKLVSGVGRFTIHLRQKAGERDRAVVVMVRKTMWSVNRLDRSARLGALVAVPKPVTLALGWREEEPGRVSA